MRPILLIRAGGLGDVLLLWHAVASLRAQGSPAWLMGPRRHASALVESAGVAAILDSESVDVAALYQEAGHVPPQLAQELARCAAAVAFTKSAALVAGLQRWLPSVVVHAPLPPAGRHAADWCCDAVRPFAPILPHAPSLRANAEERLAIRGLVNRLPPGFVAIHPGSGSPGKNWPPERFATAIEGLTRGDPWALVEGPADASAGRALGALPGAVSLRGLSVRQLGAALALSGVFIGNDSGVSHLAAAWGAPTLALFGPSSPTTWAPRGRLVEIVAAEGARMSDIDVVRVVKAAERLRTRASSSEAPGV